MPALEGQTWNNLCLSGDRLLVRNGQEAACYRLPLLAATPAGSATDAAAAEEEAEATEESAADDAPSSDASAVAEPAA
jgi:hypothetical protein